MNPYITPAHPALLPPPINPERYGIRICEEELFGQRTIRVDNRDRKPIYLQWFRNAVEEAQARAGAVAAAEREARRLRALEDAA